MNESVNNNLLQSLHLDKHRKLFAVLRSLPRYSLTKKEQNHRSIIIEGISKIYSLFFKIENTKKVSVTGIVIFDCFFFYIGKYNHREIQKQLSMCFIIERISMKYILYFI